MRDHNRRDTIPASTGALFSILLRPLSRLQLPRFSKIFVSMLMAVSEGSMVAVRMAMG